MPVNKTKKNRRVVVSKSQRPGIRLPGFGRQLSVKSLLVVGLIFGVLGAVTLNISRAAVPNAVNATADADWMMGLSIAGGPMNGALANQLDKQQIRPYQSNLGALGLSRATQITGDKKYVNVVWNHLSWYAAHTDSRGYVHDWDLVNGVWSEAPNTVQDHAYDSTDSYAASFLLAARTAYRVDSDPAKLANLRGSITTALNAIHSTQQADGLTWAIPEPNYHVKLLEDNVETYNGLLAAVTLSNALGDTAQAATAQSYADSMKTGLESLWSPTNNYYNWAKHETGALQPTNWTVLSPDAMEQGWAVAFGTATGSRAASLLNQLDAAQPNWDKPAQNGNNFDVTLMGWGYYLNGRGDRAQTAAANIRADALARNRIWPFNAMSAGELIILESEGENLVFDSSPAPPPPPANKPDLVVTSVGWSPASPAKGNPVTFNATIKNQGTAATPAGTIVGIAFYVDGVKVTWSGYNGTSLAAGATRAQSADGGPSGSTWPATAGSHTIQAFVDDTNLITEGIEDNNKLSAPLTVVSGDVTPPSVPTGLYSPSRTGNSINLAWNASADTVGVSGYRIYRNNTQVGTATSLAYTDKNLASTTNYTYRVSAYDAAGNVSAQSSAVTVKTKSCFLSCR